MMVQNLPEISAGEDRTLTLYARDASNVPLSLSAAVISWRVGRGAPCTDTSWPTFTKTGTVTNAAGGAFTVPIAASDTQWLEGDFAHEAWATISTQVTLVTRGRLRIRPYIST